MRRRTREREETIERRRQEAKASLVNQEEDRANTAKDVALVRIRLPDGSNSQRKFDPLDELQRLFDFGQSYII